MDNLASTEANAEAKAQAKARAVLHFHEISAYADQLLVRYSLDRRSGDFVRAWCDGCWCGRDEPHLGLWAHEHAYFTQLKTRGLRQLEDFGAHWENAARSGNVLMLQWLADAVPKALVPVHHIAQKAISEGHLAVLMWLEASGSDASWKCVDARSLAVERSEREILNWMRSNNCH